MNFDISSTGGLIRLGRFALLWENYDAYNDFPGFTAISTGNYSLEIGEIDSGNGLFLTKYNDGDVEYSKELIQF